jgi:hypothetical protein
MRTVSACAALMWILVVAAPAGAQSEMPTELWSEYPLVQTVERPEAGTAVGPFLPPDPEAAPATGESTWWSLWLALLALSAIGMVYAVRAISPVAISGMRRVGGRARARHVGAPARPRKPRQRPERSGRPRAPVTRRQYAPRPLVPVAEPTVEPEVEPRRYVMRRTGLLRSRFVVVADRPGSEVEPVGRSRSFWSVGSAGRLERGAGEAWSRLVDELRSGGWEPEAARSDYYVLLRPVEDAPASVPETIEAYTLTSEDPDGP